MAACTGRVGPHPVDKRNAPHLHAPFVLSYFGHGRQFGCLTDAHFRFFPFLFLFSFFFPPSHFFASQRYSSILALYHFPPIFPADVKGEFTASSSIAPEQPPSDSNSRVRHATIHQSGIGRGVCHCIPWHHTIDAYSRRAEGIGDSHAIPSSGGGVYNNNSGQTPSTAYSALPT